MFFQLAAISLTSLAYLLYSLRLTWPETEITIVSRCVCRLLASNLEFMGLSLLHILHRSWKDSKLPLCFPCLVVSKGDHCRRPYVDVSTDGIGNESKKYQENTATREEIIMWIHSILMIFISSLFSLQAEGKNLRLFIHGQTRAKKRDSSARGREKMSTRHFSATLHSSFAIVCICVTRKWNNNLLSERGCMQQRKRVVRMDVKPTGGGNGKTLPSFSWTFFWRNMSKISTMINDLTHENSIIML